MPIRNVSDHGSLAILARQDTAELRPLMLRVQVQSFAASGRRDAETIRSFEMIALGLVPLVTDDVLAEAAAVLRTVPDAPRSVLDALADRIGRDAPQGGRDDAEMRAETLAASPPFVLDPATLAAIVDRAMTDPVLAAVVLRRPEPSVYDRAALYRHADDAARQAIRTDLDAALGAVHVPRPPGSGEGARTIAAAAEKGDPKALIVALAARLGIGPGVFDLHTSAGQELFVFGLLACGLQPPEITRILLVCGAPLSRSVEAVFRLTRLAQGTSLPVAAFFAGRERIAPRRPVASPDAAHAAGSLRADGRADVKPATRAGRSRRERDSSARADRRS